MIIHCMHLSFYFSPTKFEQLQNFQKNPQVYRYIIRILKEKK